MARGNHVDSIRVIKKFGLFIVTPESKREVFDYYTDIYITKSGTLIGKWGKKPYEYRDYLMMYGISPDHELIRRTSNYLFFKIPEKEA